MTNSRLTDPDVLEFRFSVWLESFDVRANTGGAGQWQGGNGGVRRVRFSEPMTASILSNGRKYGAFGMAGGQPGRSAKTLWCAPMAGSKPWATSARPICSRAM